MNKDKVCCACNEHKRFLGRVNGGRNYYCNSCITKIKKSRMDYWQDCSFIEFLQSMNDSKPPRPHSDTPMADGLRRAWAEMGLDSRPSSKRRRRILNQSDGDMKL